jgi:hypothetical protein
MLTLSPGSTGIQLREVRAESSSHANTHGHRSYHWIAVANSLSDTPDQPPTTLPEMN